MTLEETVLSHSSNFKQINERMAKMNSNIEALSKLIARNGKQSTTSDLSGMTGLSNLQTPSPFSVKPEIGGAADSQ